MDWENGKQRKEQKALDTRSCVCVADIGMYRGRMEIIGGRIERKKERERDSLVDSRF